MKRTLKSRPPVLFWIFLLSFLFGPVPSFSTIIEGVILSSDGLIADSTASAYANFRDIRAKNPSYVSLPGDRKGFYRLELPPGEYYITASGTDGEHEYYSYHGANPINVEKDNLWIPIMALPRSESVMMDSTSSRLSGKVIFKDRPVQNARVSIYSPNDRIFRGMGFLSGTTDSDGLFSFSPEPGEYVVVARKRKDASGLRPLIKGDLFCFFASNPVSVKASGETYIEIPCYPKDDLRVFLDEKVYANLLVKKSGEESIRLRENRINKTDQAMSLKGRVTDLAGKPMRGLYVMAYKGKPDQMFQMLSVRTMPEYLVRTDDEGYYTIDSAEEGTYFLVARELAGEAPAKGENYGLFEKNTDHSVELKKDSIHNADIVVSRVMAEGAQETGRSQLHSTKTFFEDTYGSGAGSQGTVLSNHRYSEDTVIETDTVWEGDIVIKGVVQVRRGATLVIRPGSTISFKKIDRNRDGIGDSRIEVSGRLLAEGTPAHMIRFTSGEEKPGKKDWSYLLLFVSGDRNIISNCVFEYAYTGLQVHFSRAVISDSIFTGNHEAIRYGRAELQLEHNDIVSNNYGIRYTRLEGPVHIRYNNIRNNKVGIFHVPSNQNIIDFSNTLIKKEELHTHQPLVSYNNIAYNEEYNFRLGERQGYNISLTDNWWGSAADESIQNLIFDERRDNSLGRVFFKPFLKSPVQDAGVRRGG